MARIADDEDFFRLKQHIEVHKNWCLEVSKGDTKVWTMPVEMCNFKMVKIHSLFEDVTPDVLFDVLHDPDYRKVWDSHMLDSFEIGVFNVNNDVGYYASRSFPCLYSLENVLFSFFILTLRVFPYFSVMSASFETERLYPATFLVGYGRRTNAHLKISLS